MNPNQKSKAASGKLKQELQKLLEEKRNQNTAMQKIILGLRKVPDEKA